MTIPYGNYHLYGDDGQLRHSNVEVIDNTDTRSAPGTVRIGNQLHRRDALSVVIDKDHGYRVEGPGGWYLVPSGTERHRRPVHTRNH